MSAGPKIFCVGFHKTGTTSLYAALTELGYRVSGTIGHRLTAERLHREGAALCISTARKFDAVEDMPWPIFFRELDAAFPGSKFVLTVRAPDAWFASIDKHFGDVDSEMHRFIYGAEHGRARDNRERWLAVMAAHNEAVRAHFAGRPDQFLEMNLTAGEGWARLAPFLGRAIPTTPFPVKNTSADRSSLAYRLKRRIHLALGRTPHPERLV
jgi:hypothetical protein